MSAAKIQLSDIEMDLVQNSRWILTKREIIDKVYNLFGLLSNEYVSLLNQNNYLLPEEIISMAPKISKGENYHGLPYVVLDYPRYFDKENIFAIRNLFWWGNYFSSTLLIKGIYKNRFAEKIAANYNFLAAGNYAVCIAEDEWDFRFNENNFIPVSKITSDKWREIIFEKKFIKISVKISLTQWNNMQEILTGYFESNMNAAGINFRGGEINL
jgi:hypothetical protein